MATDFRTLGWYGNDTATAQPGCPAGFTAGRAYIVKAAAIDNAAIPPAIWVLLVNDTDQLQAINVTTGDGFTFQ